MKKKDDKTKSKSAAKQARLDAEARRVDAPAAMNGAVRAPMKRPPGIMPPVAAIVDSPARLVGPGSNKGLKQVPAGEESTLMIWVTEDGKPMSPEQLLFVAQQKSTGKRWVPKPPPPPEMDETTKRFMELREEKKKEANQERFAALRERAKGQPRKTSIKRRVNQLVGGKRPTRAKKAVDPNAPRPENPYAAGSMKNAAYALFLTEKDKSVEKVAPKIVKLGATESTARGWLRVFARYLSGGEK